MFLENRPRRKPISLNVTALIDVCAILVIFLVMGTFFGESSVTIPGNMQVPKSVSKESLDNAPRIVITDHDVTASFLSEPVPLAMFRADGASSEPSPAFAAYRDKLKAFVDGIPREARGSGVLLNVIADRTAPYKNIFDVIATFRSAGFQSILFIAQGM